jgi:hypothetical protein
MVKVTLYGVLKTEANGARTWAGYTTEPTIEGLIVQAVDMLDPEDGTANRWVLAAPSAVTLLSEEAITALKAGEKRRATIAKLTNEELEALGLSRE